MSLYGYSRPTTPKLDAWARDARVYDNAVSVAGYTLPSHTSMFTGLLPSEHCTNNDNKRLPQDFTTVAELLQRSGYATYLFSANPNISKIRQLAQGFETTEHPWSPRYRAEALRIMMQSKLPEEDQSSDLGRKFKVEAEGGKELTPWNIKAAGELTEQALLGWLETIGPDRPYFAFLNYMEAHRPLIPSREARSRMMSEAEIALSYKVDRAWLPTWEYTFGLRDYSAAEIALTRAAYDATIAELDDHFASLLAGLEAAGFLENTVVILTSDHGEHLGEQHMLDHQFSLHRSVLNIPLVVHFPSRFPKGRDTTPVMNFDLFPTLVELAGLASPQNQPVQSVSLLQPQNPRVRLAEDPSGSTSGLQQVQLEWPRWDPSPWRSRPQRAMIDDHYKFIWNANGDHHLYELEKDVLEDHNLIGSSEDADAIAERLGTQLESRYPRLVKCLPVPNSRPVVSRTERELLDALGYTEYNEKPIKRAP